MDSSLVNQLNNEIISIIPELKKIRQELHQIPEIALKEFKTSKKIRFYLQETSLKFWNSLMETDVVADLDVSGEASTICFRADMDALPIQENTGLTYTSRNKKFMHACGHDGHTAILIGTALILEKLKKLLSCNIRFVFQPGEEVQAAGAKLVEMGVLKGVHAVYALHGFPGAPIGNIYSRPGVMLAAAHMFRLRILGKGGHGATPHLAHNPIPVAAKISLLLKELFEKIDKKEPAVVTVCSLQAGNTATVIPDEAVIRGTARYLSSEVGEEIEKKIKHIVSETCKKEKIEYVLYYDKRYHLPLINTEQAYCKVRNLVIRYLNNQFGTIDSPLMWAEDFAFYLNKKPGCMFLLGLGETSAPLHSSRFDFNDDAIYYGILTFCLLALDKPDVQK